MNLRSSATFSACGRYRYVLERVWAPDEGRVMFVGLNPSTADAVRDDPTVRRCVGFARRWGYGGVIVVNLFAYRSTDPGALRRVLDPIGPDNDAAIARSQSVSALVIAAWGNHGCFRGRDAQVLAMLESPHCLGLNRDGSPAHPLYLPGDLRPFPMGVTVTP